MSNAYAFDFLRTEHTLEEDGRPKPITSNSNNNINSEAQKLLLNNNDEDQLRALAARVAHKPDLEKQFDVIHFLQAHRSAGCLAPEIIFKATGIDLAEADESVAQMLQRNSKIRVEKIPDPENPSLLVATYAYQAKYNHVRDLKTLLAQINRCKNGVPMRDLMDAYDGVDQDLQMLITAGDVLAIVNSEDKDKILFPRGESFLVEMDGIIALPDNFDPSTIGIKQEPGSVMPGIVPSVASSAVIPAVTSSDMPAPALSSAFPSVAASKEVVLAFTDVDPMKQIRRGEAINVGGQWFRVSSAVKEGVPLSEQPVRAQAPLSVVSMLELSKRNEQDGYIRPLNHQMIPLDAPLKDTGVQNILHAKAARDKLHKLAHNINGARSSMSTAAQLLSSNAHAANPTTLAQSFAMAATGNGNAGGGNVRKRPNVNKSSSSDSALLNANSSASKKSRRDAVQAQQAAASDPALSLYSHARRHGCTKDVRNMYLAMNNVPESDVEFKALLVHHKLLEAGEQLRRPRLAKQANVDNDGKPKKRRYYERKNQRNTNTHLEGTEVGALLRRAQERQQQGKSVGDGGM